jgi:hypothetical protein
MHEWERLKKSEETLPERFDPEKSKPGSDYNLHHNIVEATPEEFWRLIAMREADEMAEKKGLYILHIDGGKKKSAAGEEGEGAIGALLKEPNLSDIPGASVSERIDPVADPHCAEYHALMAGLKMASRQLWPNSAPRGRSSDNARWVSTSCERGRQEQPKCRKG